MAWLLTKAFGNDSYLQRYVAEMVIAIIKQKSLKTKWHPKDRIPSCLILTNILDIDLFIQLGDVCKQINRILKKKRLQFSWVLLFQIRNQLKYS